jgi:hypothetical protein
MIYENYRRNHVIYSDREAALDNFLNATLNGQNHKMKHACNSNSEDALTWSCFDVLRCLPKCNIVTALDEILEDAYPCKPFSFANESGTKIHIGKWYSTLSKQESTELDASIETDTKLIFFEAKLYGAIEMPDAKNPCDQIVKKLRVGLDIANNGKTVKEFYFVFLDVAPMEKLLSLEGSGDFAKKRESADRFNLYKTDSNALQNELQGISMAKPFEPCNMGWLTWSCLFKTVLRAVIQSKKQ